MIHAPLLSRVMLALLLVCAGLGLAPARAADDVFTVPDVVMDITAGTALDARTKAMNEGQATAFHRLLERLVAPADLERVSRINNAALLDLVLDVSVDHEKGAGGHYIATLTVHFKPAAVRNYLRGHGVTFTEPTQAVAVIPVFQSGPDARPELWEDTNPWRAVWTNRPPHSGPVPVTVPIGDLDDLATISAEQAAAADPKLLAAVARKHGASATLIAHAIVVAASPPTVEMRLTGSQPIGRADPRQYVGVAGETLDSVLARAVEGTLTKLDEIWKHPGAAPTAPGTQGMSPEERQLTFMMPIVSFADWLSARRTLAALPLIKSSIVQAIKRDMAQVTIYYGGDDSQLIGAFGQYNLLLEKSGTIWKLTRVDVPPAAVPTVPATLPGGAAGAPGIVK
ncbi:MAG: DUF2066 domain-containing protein [Alphaproteobacteria bacterium]|nr:DUF2066 domain-containing protein [Alphaproteobacteria bacterium]